MTKLLSLSLCLILAGCAFGAPTPYEKYKSEQKTECQLECEKAHKESDKDGRRRCVRICEAKKELEAEKK